MNKYLKILTVIFCFCFLIAGCQRKPANSNSISFKAGLIIPGAYNDGSWSQRYFKGFERISDELGADFNYYDNVSLDKAEFYIDDFAAKGCTMIVIAGAQFINIAMKVADKYPEISFVVIGPCTGNNRNLGGISFEFEKAAYLAGFAAGLKSETGTAGFVAGGLYPHILRQIEWFTKGFKSAHPDGVVESVSIDTWFEGSKAVDAVLSLKSKGADVFVINADSAGIAGYRYCEENKIYTIGWNDNLSDLFPDTVLVNMVPDIDAALLEASNRIIEGHWEGVLHRYTIERDIIRLEGYNRVYSRDELERIDDIYRLLMINDLSDF